MSELPHSIKKLKHRTAFYGWLRGITRIDDLLKPGVLTLWDGLTVTQKRHIKRHVRESLCPGDLEKFERYLMLQRRERKAKGVLKRYTQDKEFVLSMKQKLSDSSSVLVILPPEALTDGILTLRSAGMSPQEVAEMLAISETTVCQIATEPSLKAFEQRQEKGDDVLLAFLENDCRRELVKSVLNRRKPLTLGERLRVLTYIRQERQSKMSEPQDGDTSNDKHNESLDKDHKDFLRLFEERKESEE